MKLISTFLSGNHERSITIFGVMFVGAGLLSAPSGIVLVLMSTYGIAPRYWALAIIAGMFLKALSGGNLIMRALGITPFLLFSFMSLSLWLRGLTGLLQSQILYMVILAILIQPLTRDIVKKISQKSDDQ